MSLTSDQVEHEIKQLTTVCHELSERVAHLQKRVSELEKRALEDIGEYEEPAEGPKSTLRG